MTSPARKPTAARRAELIDAALHIVAAEGIAALSTQRLADAVGLTSGAMFKHIAGRDALLVAMAERVVALLAATAPSAHLPPRAQLRALAEARLALVGDRAGVLALVSSEQFRLALPPAAAALLRGAVADTRALVASILRAAQAEGAARADVPVEGLTLLFMGALQATALSRRLGAPLDGAPALDAFDALLDPPPPTE